VASQQCISQIAAVVALNTAPGGRATTVSWNPLLVGAGNIFSCRYVGHNNLSQTAIKPATGSQQCAYPTVDFGAFVSP